MTVFFMNMQKNITIAIQKDGRLSQHSIGYLAGRGICAQKNGRRLVSVCNATNTRILWVRDDDIPHYVESGVADCGIVGTNVLAERGVSIPIISYLDFAYCKLVIAAPRANRICSLSDLRGKKIATSYPRVLQKTLKENNIRADIIYFRGSVEIAPELGLSDAICDLSQTGATLREHNMTPFHTILESQAVLIGTYTIPHNTVSRPLSTKHVL